MNTIWRDKQKPQNKKCAIKNNLLSGDKSGVEWINYYSGGNRENNENHILT